LISEVIYSILNGTAAIQAIVGNRIFPNTIPQKVSKPSIIFEVISRVPTNTHGTDGKSKMDDYRVEITIISTTKTVTDQLGTLVRNALDYFTNTIVAGDFVHWVYYNNETDSFNGTAGQDGLYIKQQEYKFSIKQV
tara:strand:+ start:1249 stop:1656 length:408 start_codon:yes stop_codon:yes gene_type:complete